MPTRLGLLGGTFDPVHEGHVAAGRAARAALALDQVQLVPAHVPPHRAVGPRASTPHRFAMAAIAALEEPGWTVSDAEIGRDGPSFTYDTLRGVQAAGLAPSQIFFILGADAFAEIATWSRYPAVLDQAHFVVVTRPGASLAGAGRSPSRSGRPGPPGQRPGRSARHRHRAGGSGHAAGLVDGDPRTRGAGFSLAGLVPPRVEQYIRRHGLYARTAAGPGRRATTFSGRCLAWRRRGVDECEAAAGPRGDSGGGRRRARQEGRRRARARPA